MNYFSSSNPANSLTNFGANLFKKNNLSDPGTTTVNKNINTHIANNKMKKKNTQPNVCITYMN